MEAGDWFAVLEKRLDEISGSVKYRHRPPDQAAVVRDLAGLFFGIWIRFAVDVGHEPKLEPTAWDFASYRGSKKFDLKEDFPFDAFSRVIMTDTRWPQPVSLSAQLTRTSRGQEVVFEMQAGTEPAVELHRVRLHRFEPRAALMVIMPILLDWFEAHSRGDQRIVLDRLEEMR